MTLRILFLTGEYPPMQGGIGDFTALLADRLADRGLEPAVLTARGARTVRDGRVPVEPSLPHWGWTTWPVVLGEVDRWRPKVVHLQYQAAAFSMHPAIHLLPWWLRRRRPHLGLAVTFHDLRVPYLLPGAGPIRLLALRLLARGCHAVATTNEPDRRTLQSWLPGGHRRPSLIPLAGETPPDPPSPDARRRVREGLGIGGDELTICFFGLLNRSKGIDHLLQALAQVRGEGLRPRLLLLGATAGASDPTNVTYGEAILAEAARLGLDSLLTWAGYVPREELGAYFQAADIAALPFTDGVSLRRTSLIAVLAHGLPLVTTTPAEPEAAGPLRHEEHCLLVPPGDPTALAAAIRRLAGDPGLRERLAAGARQAATNFDWQVTVEASLAFYRSLAGDG